MRTKLICLSFIATFIWHSAGFADSREVSSPAKEIVLLTSFDPAQSPNSDRIPARIRQALEEIVRQAPRRLENIFLRHYRSDGYVLRVLHHATQADIWEAAHSSNTLGIIWISHGSGHSSGSITDADNFEVASVFQDFHPHLRFLSVVACDSGSTLEKLFSKFSIRRRFPNLWIHGSVSLTDATEGLRETLSWSDKVLGIGFQTPLSIPVPLPATPTLELRVTRSFPNIPIALPGSLPIMLPAVRVETITGKVLGVFPPSSDKTSQVLLVRLPGHQRGFTQPEQLNLIMNAGDNPTMSLEKMALGRFDIHVETQGKLSSDSFTEISWTPYSDQKGSPIGLTQNLYEFTGSIRR